MSATPQETIGGHVTPLPCVDLGWVVVLGTDDDLQQVVMETARAVEAQLQKMFTHYSFRSNVVSRKLRPVNERREPVDLLELGVIEREGAHWDFACVVSAEDLRTHKKPFTLGVPASSLNVCALSVARLRSVKSTDGHPTDEEPLVKRCASLFFHLFGHLNDLPHTSSASNYMHPPRTPSELDLMRSYCPENRARLDYELGKEADPRLEEEQQERGALRFYIEATWRNRQDIWQSVRKAKPWWLVLRLSKLATTATSTLIVLMLTAESWDVGTRLNQYGLVAASLCTLLVTSAYVLRKQGLVGRARGAELTEQRVAANVSVGLIVILVMSTTYAGLFFISLGFGELAFPPALLEAWFAGGRIFQRTGYLSMAAFVATLGVILGALGASFEGTKYFRHAAIVDEET